MITLRLQQQGRKEEYLLSRLSKYDINGKKASQVLEVV